MRSRGVFEPLQSKTFRVIVGLQHKAVARRCTLPAVWARLRSSKFPISEPARCSPPAAANDTARCGQSSTPARGRPVVSFPTQSISSVMPDCAPLGLKQDYESYHCH